MQCIVTVGYPEVVSRNTKISEETSVNGDAPASLCYNSTITVSPEGRTLAHYRKTHLYYTDESWAQESDSKWLTISLPLEIPLQIGRLDGEQPDSRSVVTTFGICMSSLPTHFLPERNFYCFRWLGLPICRPRSW